MKTQTTLISPFSTKTLHTDSYEMIENETLTNENYGGITISGSLFSHTLFKNVSFDSCVFFATKIEECRFLNCNFTNCSMQFSTFSQCSFTGCNFENTIWDVSNINKSLLQTCFVDRKTSYFLVRQDNTIINCFTEKNRTWEDLERTITLNMEEELIWLKAS